MRGLEDESHPYPSTPGALTTLSWRQPIFPPLTFCVTHHAAMGNAHPQFCWRGSQGQVLALLQAHKSCPHLCVSHSHVTPSDGRGKPNVFLMVALWTHGVLPEGTVNIVHQRLGPSEGHRLPKEARPALGPPMNTAHNNGHPLFQRPSGTQDGRKEMCSSPSWPLVAILGSGTTHHAPASGPDPARDSYFLRHPLAAYSGLRGSQNHLAPSSAWWVLGFWTDSAFWDRSYIFISPLPDLFPVLSSAKASVYYSLSFG